jgi:hypothetical protein
MPILPARGSRQIAQNICVQGPVRFSPYHIAMLKYQILAPDYDRSPRPRCRLLSGLKCHPRRYRVNKHLLNHHPYSLLPHDPRNVIPHNHTIPLRIRLRDPDEMLPVSAPREVKGKTHDALDAVARGY